MKPDPQEAPGALFESRAPWLLGVRHHSVACALAMPAWLEAAKPSRIYLEMPAELQPWIEWVGHPETDAPVALASVVDGEVLSFYPLARFSPERVAIAWAVERGVEVVAFDTSAGPKASAGKGAEIDIGPLWDRAVESRAGGDPEDVRRAALRVGWALRAAAEPRAEDLCRETFMRSRMTAPEGSVAIVGAYHAAALLEEPLCFREVEAAEVSDAVTSLVPYEHALLDERSGYPAGILDPGWHEAVFDALGEGATPDDVLSEEATKLVRLAREKDHPGATSAAYEIVRLARGLTRLRGQPHPTRAELVEAARTVLGRGGGVGFDRLLRNAFVGVRVGKVAKDAPRSGLLAHFGDALEGLRLPGRGEVKTGETKELRLDVLRSDLDRRRHLALTRASIAGVRYGRRRRSEAAGGLETLQRIWEVAWTPATDASLAFAGRHGVTLKQAAAGTLTRDVERADSEDALGASRRLALLHDAFAAGLPAMATEWLEGWRDRWAEDADLPALVAFVELLGRVLAGHEPGIADDDPVVMACGGEQAEIFRHAEQLLEGLAGSDRLEDARALMQLVWLGGGGDRLRLHLQQMAREGSPTMRGAAWGASTLAGYEVEDASWVASWVDRAVDAEGRRALAEGLAGLLVGAGLLLEVAPGLFGEVSERVEALGDDDFLRRLPALRHGFGVLGKSERARFLMLLEDRGAIDLHAMDRLPVDAESLAGYAALDHEAHARTSALLGRRMPGAKASEAKVGAGAKEAAAHEEHALSRGDRWRLILGQQPQALSPRGARIAGVLGGAEGGTGAGTGKAQPAVREWIDELEALFGVDVCQEIVASEAAGDPELVAELDAKHVRPSVQLLTEILELAGHLGEAALAKVRPLVKKIIDELTRELADQVMPALRGVRSARPTRRPSSRLDVPRTIARNLHTARRDDEGRIYLVPEGPIFRSAEVKRLTWEVFVLLDVSGSMEPSVVHTALMAGILAGVPWVDLKLFAFSTEVVDLSEHVADPLKLLLEVHVGGGTDIGGAVRFVESQVRRPRRTMLLVVSDFEELGTGRPLVEAVQRLREAEVRVMGIASLDDAGNARFNAAMARTLRAVGMPVAALSPSALARWMKAQVQS